MTTMMSTKLNQQLVLIPLIYYTVYIGSNNVRNKNLSLHFFVHFS